MQKFSYRLESLLKLKAEIERQKQNELSEVQRRVLKQKECIDHIDKDFMLTLDSKSTRQTGPILIAELLVYSRYLLKLKRDKISNLEVLRALDSELEKKRQELVESTIERKKHEKLKEKLFEKHVDSARKTETKETDEIGANSYRINSRRE